MDEFKLTHADVDRLLDERSVDARVATAGKLAVQFSLGELSESERQLAEQIFRLMVRDAEWRVRQSLAVNLKQCADVPRDVAVTLAEDVEAVALPMLEFSSVLTDADLIAIVRSQSAAKQVAVARRPAVSDVVSQALVDTGRREVVAALVENESAAISEVALQKIVDDFGEDSTIQESLVQRAKLPMTVAERLVSLVSDHLCETLISRHKISARTAADIAGRSRERATVTLAAGADREDVEGLVRHLRSNGRLTASILFRAACMGDVALFEAGMAELASIPVDNARRLIHDPGPLGLAALCNKAGIPEPLLPAFRCAVDVARETDFDGGEQDRERFSRRMIERILTKSEVLGLSFDSPDLEYLLSKINQLPSDVALRA